MLRKIEACIAFQSASATDWHKDSNIVRTFTAQLPARSARHCLLQPELSEGG